jgi:hypothetical protein
MKKLWLGIILIIPLFSYALAHRITVTNSYESNILALSDETRDEFSEQQNPEKFKIDSLDDWITSAGLLLEYKHYIKKHTQLIRFSGNYEKYWNNSIKDNGYMGISVKQYFSRTFNIALYYYYYPEIYVNHYRSVLESSEYREFTYAKNSFFTIWSLKLTKTIEMRYRFDFDQLFYNEYFTEYDADNFTNALEIRWRAASHFLLTASYDYKMSRANGVDAYKNSSITDLKDPSYNRNSYQLGFLFRDVIADIDVQLDFSYQEKYYDSSLPENTYHYGRDEFYKRAKISFSKNLSKQFRLQPEFECQLRDVRSPFSQVVSDKEFDNYKIGFQISYFPK